MALWSISPNWKYDYSVSLEFKTSVFTSRSRREQRIAQRTTPRKTFKFTVSRADAAARKVAQALRIRQGRSLQLPDQSRFVRLTESAVATYKALYVDRVDQNWLTVGAPVAISFNGNYAAGVIAAVDAAKGMVTLVDALTETWLVDAKVHPLVTGAISPSVSSNSPISRAIEVEVSFDATPGVNIADSEGAPYFTMLGGREIFAPSPNYASSLKGDFSTFPDIVDFGRGRIETYFPVDYNVRTRQFELLLKTRRERAELIAFFMRCKGQRGEFYMPSYEIDMVAASTAAEGSLNATMSGIDPTETFLSSDAYRAIVFRDDAGVAFYRRIVSASATAGNSVLTTDVPWPCAITPKTRISWLQVNRHATDQMDVRCVTDEVSQVQISTTSLEDLPVGPIDAVSFTYDGAAQWMLDFWSDHLFIEGADFHRLINRDYATASL